MGQSGPVGNPEHMRIDRKGGLVKQDIQNDIGCFSADTRKCFQVVPRGWDAALMSFNEYL